MGLRPWRGAFRLRQGYGVQVGERRPTIRQMPEYIDLVRQWPERTLARSAQGRANRLGEPQRGSRISDAKKLFQTPAATPAQWDEAV